MYCEKCRRIFDGPVCPECGKARHAREVRNEDPCFLIERGEPYAGMLAEVLRQNDIPSLEAGRMGAGLAARVGSLLESRRFYVRYDDLKRAGALMDELFGEDAPR